jgi:hypothetical protein
LSLAVDNFWEAGNLYLRVTPEPPRKHINGIINRVVNAGYRLILLEVGDSFDRAGDRIKRAFTEEKDREKAIKIIREVFAESGASVVTYSKILETIQRAEKFLKA